MRLAEVLGIPPQPLYKLIRDGDIPNVAPPGSKVLIDPLTAVDVLKRKGPGKVQIQLSKYGTSAAQLPVPVQPPNPGFASSTPVQSAFVHPDKIPLRTPSRKYYTYNPPQESELNPGDVIAYDSATGSPPIVAQVTNTDEYLTYLTSTGGVRKVFPAAKIIEHLASGVMQVVTPRQLLHMAHAQFVLQKDTASAAMVQLLIENLTATQQEPQA